jgi:hypothetical protein
MLAAGKDDRNSRFPTSRRHVRETRQMLLGALQHLAADVDGVDLADPRSEVLFDASDPAPDVQHGVIAPEIFRHHVGVLAAQALEALVRGAGQDRVARVPDGLAVPGRLIVVRILGLRALEEIDEAPRIEHRHRPRIVVPSPRPGRRPRGRAKRHCSSRRKLFRSVEVSKRSSPVATDTTE